MTHSFAFFPKQKKDLTVKSLAKLYNYKLHSNCQLYVATRQ